MHGLGAREFARRIGINHVTLGLLESGRLVPSDRQRAKFQQLFGDNADSLFERFTDTDLRVDGVSLSAGCAS